MLRGGQRMPFARQRVMFQQGPGHESRIPHHFRRRSVDRAHIVQRRPDGANLLARERFGVMLATLRDHVSPLGQQGFWRFRRSSRAGTVPELPFRRRLEGP
jgi:hypothetical protein